jgi:hypothetical protein
VASRDVQTAVLASTPFERPIAVDGGQGRLLDLGIVRVDETWRVDLHFPGGAAAALTLDHPAGSSRSWTPGR